MERMWEPTADDLQILRDWIKQTPHIPQDYDDQFLSCFYQGCKGSLQKTKLVLEGYCSLGAKHPEMFADCNIDSKKMKEYLDAAYFFPIPAKTESDDIILVSAIVPGADPMKHHVLELFKLQLMFMLHSIKENTFRSRKIFFLADGRGLSLKFLRDLTPQSIIAWITAVEKSLPVRIGGLHAVNMPKLAEWIFLLIKKQAKLKLSQRVFVHSQISGLLKYFPKERLPEEYGGTLGPSKTLFENWKQILIENKEYFIREETRIRELDPVRPISASDNTTETFKKLSID